MHIFTAKLQSATNYKCDAGFNVSWAKHKLLTCDNCRKKRRAKYLVVQSYYDGDRFFCMEGRGCNKTNENRK